MSNELQAALIGLAGAIVGAWLGARATYRYADEQGRRSMTLKMFESYQALLPQRMTADSILSTLIAQQGPLDYETLYTSLPQPSWSAISHVRHFWAQLALLKSKAQLDSSLATALFAEDAKYWHITYFARMEEKKPPKSENWSKTWQYLKAWL
jgi:hypothetical protein